MPLQNLVQVNFISSISIEKEVVYENIFQIILNCVLNLDKIDFLRDLALAVFFFFFFGEFCGNF